MVVEKAGGSLAVTSLRKIDESMLPPGEVTVAVEYSTLN
jgi:NADPH:quinone reductase-like Zn-dependent oxidoreductase